ncbi:MAG: methionyl-tRNA formyltransferase [Propionibacteriaceae bacterium]|jgi:methionyl-tRNA formyltransferase|nr:methionyl-tRNA formyltransferase [Propionibacteriaceae bacterium]
MRLVFAGTPALALPALDALVGAGHEVAAVLTRPPAARGRSGKLRPSPVQEWAEARGVEVLVPRSAQDPALAARLAELAPDCCPVVAYGGLIPEPLLQIPPLGWINLHFSLLPAYRGAAPVQHALLNGETVTGATTFRLVPALDAGPVFRRLTVPVGPRVTAGELLDELAGRGAALLVETLAAAAAGEEPEPQPAGPVSLAPKIEPADVRLDWTRPASALDRLVRAANPEPGAWTTAAGQRLRILRAEPVDAAPGPAPTPPGRLAIGKKEVLVTTGAGHLRLLEVVPAGKRAMPAPDWARGLRQTAPAELGR